MEMNFDTKSRHAEAVQLIHDKFYHEVISGLREDIKKLPSKYFYDSEGDELFQRIMTMPEYYLTRCELEIFRSRTADLAKAILQQDGSFDLIEMGAGDASKSIYLLKYLTEQRADFTYMPIDISGNILSILQSTLKGQLPSLDMMTLQGEYFDMLERAAVRSDRRKVLLFLGSNIGNMELEQAYDFCAQIRKKLNKGDILLIGFDLKKNPHVILKAYNDESGITAKFNLNLLVRINRELGANFELQNFEHYQNYDPVSGACRSYLISLRDQEVCIRDQTVVFSKHELIDMEVSHKFSDGDIAQLAKRSGFSIIDEISDPKKWFVDAIWQVR